MSTSDSESDAPPLPQLPISVTGNHPVWQNSVAGGRGRGRGRGAPMPLPGEVAPTRFERISLAALEASARLCADGAESSIAPSSPAQKRTKESEATSDEDSDDEAAVTRKRRRLENLMNSAAFGAADDAGSTSEISTRAEQKKALAASFPVTGVTCVGCALHSRIAPVDRFIRENATKMASVPLFKFAALAYQREVVEPAAREGASCPPWSWRDLQLHYELHTSEEFFSRNRIVQSLALMRSTLEQRLVRCEGNERELDRGTADLLLKTIAQESRERTLLQQLSGGGSSSKKK